MRDTVLITGANGCVGYAIISQLIDSYNIIAVDRKLDKLGEFADKIQCLKANICDTEALEAAFSQVDYVIHLAAKVHLYPQNEKDIQEFYTVNVNASKNLFELCIKYNIKKVVFFSSISVYGEDNECIISETTAVNPVTHYAKTKYEAERIGIKFAEEKGLPLIILRPATIYGKFDKGNYRSLISLCKRGISVIPGNGYNVKSIIYVKDVAIIVSKLLEIDYKEGQVLVISEGNYKYIDIIRYIIKAFGFRVLKIKVPILLINFLWKLAQTNVFKKFKTLSNSIEVDNRKMCELIEYTPQYNLYSGLMDSFDYYNK